MPLAAFVFADIRNRSGDARGRVVKRDVHSRVLPASGSVRCRDLGFRVKHADLPHTVFQNVLVLVDAAIPGGRASVASQHRQDAPSSLRGSAVRRERDHRLEQDVRVDAAFGEAELPLSDLLKKELTDRSLSARALLIVGDGVLGEQVREVVPQTEFYVVSVGVLQALDGADGLDAFHVGLKAFNPCFEGRQRVRLLGRGQRTPCADHEGDGQDGFRGHRQDSTTWRRTWV